MLCLQINCCLKLFGFSELNITFLRRHLLLIYKINAPKKIFHSQNLYLENHDSVKLHCGNQELSTVTLAEYSLLNLSLPPLLHLRSFLSNTSMVLEPQLPSNQSIKTIQSINQINPVTSSSHHQGVTHGSNCRGPSSWLHHHLQFINHGLAWSINQSNNQSIYQSIIGLPGLPSGSHRTLLPFLWKPPAMNIPNSAPEKVKLSF